MARGSFDPIGWRPSSVEPICPMRLCLLPYECQADLAHDEILKSWPFRLVSNPVFSVAAQTFNFGLLWLLVDSVAFAAAMWLGIRIFALWVNMIQNYWIHDRRFGYRRYDDERDNAMNLAGLRTWLQRLWPLERRDRAAARRRARAERGTIAFCLTSEIRADHAPPRAILDRGGGSR